MTLSERIAQRKAKRDKLVTRIAADKVALARLNKEINSMEALEIQGLLQEVNLPIDEVKRMIHSMKPKPTSKGGDVA